MNKIDIINDLKSEKKFLLIKLILVARKAAVEKIQRFIGYSMFKIKKRKLILLKNIVDSRKNSLVKIQGFLHSVLIKKHLKYIKEQEERFNLRIFYPTKANSVQIKIYNFNGESYIVYDLKYCAVTETKHLYINKAQLLENKYFFVFIVDGNTTINPEFPSSYDKEGNYYNVLNVKNMMETLKAGKKKHNTTKTYTQQVKMNSEKHVPLSSHLKRIKWKYNIDELNEDNMNGNEITPETSVEEGCVILTPKYKKSFTDKAIWNLMTCPIKPILKRKPSNPSNQSNGKKVSFSQVIHLHFEEDN